MLYFDITKAQKRNGVHDSIPKAQVRGSARGLERRKWRAISVPRNTPMTPAATVMPPKVKETLDKREYTVARVFIQTHGTIGNYFSKTNRQNRLRSSHILKTLMVARW